MTGKKLLNLVAYTLQGFQFGSNIKIPMLIPANIKGDNSNMITGNQLTVLLFVIQGKSKYPIHLFKERGTLVVI